MAQGDIIAILRQAIWTILRLALPMLLVSLGIGLLIAIFQAATQIHEQTLTFVPKLVTIAVMLIILGPWMLINLTEFFERVCQQILLL
jgi:flagellar biosynthetic protein FliQ